MSPTLKEVNPTHSAAKATQGEIGEGNGVRAADAIHPVASSASDNSNEAPLSREALADETDDAVGDADDRIRSPVPASAAAVASPQKTNPPLAAASITTTTTTTTTSIRREDPSDIPADEAAFLVPPHFRPAEPFHRHLSSLDLSMRCAICKELYRAPVTLVPCLHAFCSLCVRNHFKATYTGMKRKADCPICHTPARMPGSSDYEKGILPNKQLEQQVDVYQQCRNELRDSLVRLDVLEQEKAIGILSNGDGRCGGDGGGRRGAGGESNAARREGEKRGMEEGRQRTRSSKRNRNGTVANKTRHDYSSEEVDDDDANEKNDEDYDDTPSNDSEMPSASPSASAEVFIQSTRPRERKRKPTASYHNLNRKKLIELCCKEGLDTRGNEKELRQRHSDFITLYNSEMDSEHPRSAAELAKDVRSREKAIKLEAAKSGRKQQGRLMRNLGNSCEAYNERSIGRPTSGNEAFDRTISAGFERLLAEANGKKEGRRGPTTTGGEDAAATRKSDGNMRGKSGEDDPRSAASLNNDGAGEGPPRAASSAAGAEFGRINGGDVVSPSASVDSDKTAQCPQTSPPTDNHREETSPPPAESKAPAVAGKCASPERSKPSKSKQTATKRTSPKKLKSSKSGSRSSARINAAPVSRVASLGPWVCRTCTFENTRNATRKARCEMCNAARPDEQNKEVEVVTIDC